MKNVMKVCRCFIIVLMVVMGFGYSLHCLAIETSASVFGTLGYSKSNQDYYYQRFINKDGTFDLDSKVGFQLDAKLDESFGLTVQLKSSPAANSGGQWAPEMSWGFFSWRLSNDWLFRVGKLRVPLYLNSENVDVGLTYNYDHLPVEMYGSSPLNDFNGMNLDKNISLDHGDLNIGVYFAGRVYSNWRLYLRDQAQPYYLPMKLVDGQGIVATYENEDSDRYRVSIYQTKALLLGQPLLVKSYPYLEIMPGIGYYPLPGMSGNNVEYASELDVRGYTAGADWNLGSGYRLTAEYARRVVKGSDVGPDTHAGMLGLSKKIGAWTPYINYARLVSTADARKSFNKTNNNVIPSFIFGSRMINASQRLAADAGVAYDQWTVAFGTSFKISSSSKLKIECSRTHIGAMSSLVDAPVGGNVRHENIDVFSASYNFVF